MQYCFWLSNCSLISQATPFPDEACETNCSLGRMESCWKENPKEFFALFAVILQVSTCHLCALGPCVGVHRAMVLTSDAKATGEEKSGPVDTGLTRPAAMTLILQTKSLITSDIAGQTTHTSTNSCPSLHSNPLACPITQ